MKPFRDSLRSSHFLHPQVINFCLRLALGPHLSDFPVIPRSKASRLKILTWSLQVFQDHHHRVDYDRVRHNIHLNYLPGIRTTTWLKYHKLTKGQEHGNQPKLY